MEIWRVEGNAWAREKFRTEGVSKPIDNFFESSLPTLCSMVYKELQKDNGHRYVVFSKKEGLKINRIGRIFITPETDAGNALFLRSVLSPVRQMYAKRFSVLYIQEDSTRILPEKGAVVRLAICID